mmetsp:Transcript_2114/g.4917  ORF Transcript_2114/g.4917 Transcript_2114/m.4917 type:complete len:228 (+) Transcript_2114:78-761(+)
MRAARLRKKSYLESRAPICINPNGEELSEHLAPAVDASRRLPGFPIHQSQQRFLFLPIIAARPAFHLRARSVHVSDVDVPVRVVDQRKLVVIDAYYPFIQIEITTTSSRELRVATSSMISHGSSCSSRLQEPLCILPTATADGAVADNIQGGSRVVCRGHFVATAAILLFELFDTERTGKLGDLTLLAGAAIDKNSAVRLMPNPAFRLHIWIFSTGSVDHTAFGSLE